MAQNNEKKYDSLWKKVESLVTKKGLTKSALTEVDKIYLLAKKEKKEDQLIKALLYQLNLRATLEEDDVRANGITDLEKEISTSAEPVASILNSILAEKYFFYFQQHRWQLYGRTETVNFKKDDVATWSATDLHKKIGSLYLASIANKKILQQTKLEAYEAIIVKGNARYLRPTLYDLLAHRALNYFRSDERDITKPAYAFEIKNENLFLPAIAFSKLNITTSDSFSLHHKALLICQDLLTFHAADAKPDAFIDADIIRLEIVHQFAVMENKETLYTTALDQLYSKYPLEPAAAKAAWLLAQWHVNKAASYDPLKDTSSRYEYIRALNICEKIVQQKQQSEGKSNCLSLINQIYRKELNLQTEKVNIPNQPFRTLVSFRNFTKLYLRIINLTGDMQKQLKNRYDDNYWKQLTGLTPLKNWNQSFPATNDYQRHNAEIKIDALPVGAYILLASVNENYSLDKNPLAVQFFHVSNISYVNNGNDYFMLDRDNGKPLAKAAVQMWFNAYDFNQRKDVLSKGQQVMTNDNGFVQLPVQKNTNENSLQLEVHYKNDRLFMNDYQYRVFRNENENSFSRNKEAFEKEKARVFFFMDRSIYRPGQTVYFKGIAITEDFETRKTKVLSNHKSLVKLFNANGEQSDSLEVTTNEFGSYNGHFKLPEQTLNGEFRLHDELLNGEASLSVEEYKRPKFYVDYEKLQDTYRVNDSITITGFAKAYAGNNIDGATVKYRVVRTPRFIYPWLYWKWGMPRASNMEITNGIATTTADGKFTIHFKAIPDLTIDKKLEPVFDYKVIADITDINGETRSGETLITVSYKAIQLKVTIGSGEAILLDSLKNISISTKNMNGVFVPSAAHVVINKLASPERLIRKRYWPQPDQFVIKKETYQQLFPNDEYENETNPASWGVGEKVYDRTDSTKANAGFELQPAKLTPGWYSVEVTTRDKYGEEIKDIQFIQLYDEKNNKLPSTIYSWSLQKKNAVEPGEKSTIRIGSSAHDLFIIQQVEKQLNAQSVTFKERNDPDQNKSDYRFINLSNEIKSFDFPVTENDRGGFGVFHFFVKNNRFYFISDQVNVPWTNKELTIGYESFRDKTLPGSEEKWKLKISGSKNEKLAAEMLVSMYDASLDQFKPHSWSLPDIWPTYTSYHQWNGLYNFTAIQSQERYSDNDNGPIFRNEYDALAVPSLQLPMQIRGGALNEVVVVGYGKQRSMAPTAMADMQLQKKDVARESESSMADSVAFNVSPSQAPSQNIDLSAVQIRKNFNETAFFLPDLQTDSSGSISFAFTIPEALTRWKFQAMAHTKQAALGYSTKDIITQKQLMVQPNAPRFLREGDRLELSTKIVNMTDKELTGTVHLELLNAIDMKPVDGWFQNMTANQYFTAEAGKSVAANFSIQVPYLYNGAVVYRFVAKSTSAEISDGEEASLPVLTNNLLVTESLPLFLRGNATRNYRFEKLLQSGSSETLQQRSLTVEFTSNPAWYAVQALPYLIDYPYECSEQTFNRFYANALATRIANSSPRIKAIFEKWKSSDEKSLVSNLEKNPELKSVLLEETPWVLEAKNETQQMKNIALLFDMLRMSAQLDISIGKLQQLQSPNGGFSWFKGGPDDRYITQYIITGIGHLKKLAALPVSATARLNDIKNAAITYLDKRLKEDYDNLIKSKSDIKKNNLGYLQIQYLYMRSFFNEEPVPAETTTAATYYRKQSKQFWLQQNRYMQGMIAISLNRSGDHKTASDILNSLQQNAIINEEMGMYWKEGPDWYYWYQAPVEMQSLLIEAFSEIGSNTKIIDDLKTWLLRQKQTQNWRTTKATADACYALLLQGTDWLSAEQTIEIKLGNKVVKSNDEPQQAGTGYFKKIFDGPFVNPAMGEIAIKASPSATAVQIKGSSSWGAVYWQYFEKLDKITPSSTPLKLTKQLFVEKNSDRGPVLDPVNEGASLKVGDKIKVRIALRVDRDMEYVHMKDMRAGCMEPVNVLSGYKWQGGLGYYESTLDASTNFFFNWLPKGVYVFEYPLFVNQTGNFSNGISSIQCMYAPEFASHSEGIRVTVE